MLRGHGHTLAHSLLAELARAGALLDERAAQAGGRMKAFYVGEVLKVIVAKRLGWDLLGGNVLRHKGGAMIRISRHDGTYDVAERVLRAEVVYATRRGTRRTQRQAVAAALAALRAEESRREDFGRLPL